MGDREFRQAQAEKSRKDLRGAVNDAAVQQADTGDKDIAAAFAIVQGAFDHLYEIVDEQREQIDEITEQLREATQRLKKLENE